MIVSLLVSPLNQLQFEAVILLLQVVYAFKLAELGLMLLFHLVYLL